MIFKYAWNKNQSPLQVLHGLVYAHLSDLIPSTVLHVHHASDLRPSFFSLNWPCSCLPQLLCMCPVFCQ